jgi:hypothetical protein
LIGIIGKVLRIIEETEKIQILLVLLHSRKQEISAIHYIYQGHSCLVGDQVQVNTSALDLNLGTGGYGFVMAVLPKENMTINPDSTNLENFQKREENFPGHILKLRYTPHQTPVYSIESPESDHHSLFQTPFSLEGKPILMGELHSMLPILASLLSYMGPKRRLVYIMDDQATLQLSISEHIRYLATKIDLVTITYGQALGGDIECVNLYSALEAAVKVAKADDIFISQGPGVVGTGTERGFSGMQLIHWLHTVYSSGGRPIVIPRIQTGDARERHYGLSHHTTYPLAYHALVPAYIPIPYLKDSNPFHRVLQEQIKILQERHYVEYVDVQEIKDQLREALKWYEKPIRTMGRDFLQEPYFFYTVAAASLLYQQMAR